MRSLLSSALLGLLLLAPAAASEPFDLEAVRLEHDALRVGEPAVIRVTVRNHGPGPAAGVRCTIASAGRNWGVMHARQDLRAGQEIVLEGTFTPPAAGAQDLSATVAPEDSDARNQTISENVAIEPPRLADLQVEDLEVPHPLRVGEEARLELEVANRGDLGTGGARVVLLVDGQPAGTWRLQKHLKPGNRESVRLGWTPTREGAVTLVVEVDPDGAIPELDETNNRNEGVSVDVAARRQPDLQPLELLAPQTLRQDTPGELLVRVANEGDAAAHSVHVQVSRPDGRLLVERTVRVDLAPNSSRSIALAWIPSESGDLELVATIDPQGRYAEASRDNNTLHGVVNVQPRAAADLQAVRLDAPALRAGREARLEAVVRNEGDLPVFGCRVVLLVDGQPTAIGNSQSGLEPGDEVRVPLKWTPEQPGPHKLTFEVEARAAGPERNLQDNAAAPLEVEVAEPKVP